MIFQSHPQLASVDRLFPGDIVGYSGDDWLSCFVNVATYGIPWWGLSHVAIVGEYKFPGTTELERLLFESTESTTELPCAISGQPFKGTQAFHIDQRLKDYKGKVWHYPLYRTLYAFERKRLNRFLLDTLHKPYDEMGAFRSGGVGLSWIESWLRKEDLTSIFCSEWCMSGLSTIGIHATDNVSRWSPNRMVRSLRRHEILKRPSRLK